MFFCEFLLYIPIERIELNRVWWTQCTKLLLSFIGVWPFQGKWESRIVLYLTILIAGTLIIPQMIALMELWTDTDAVFECLPPIFVFEVCLTMMATFLLHSDKYQTLLSKIIVDWQTVTSIAEKKLLEDYAERGRMLTIGYASTMYSCSSFFVLTTIFHRNFLRENMTITVPGELPFRVEYYIDDNKYYLPIFTHSVVSIIMYMTIIISFDCLFFVLVEHAIGLFATLRYKLERLGEDTGTGENMLSNASEDTAYLNIIQCIQKHQEALEYVDMLESIYSYSFLFQLGTNMIIMSMTTIKVTNDLTDFESTAKFGAYAVGQMTHLFFQSWRSQALTDEAAGLLTSTYAGKWYQTSLRCKKLFAMLLMRTGLIPELTVGKVMVMSLGTYGAVVRTSASYYTMLRSF